MWCNRRVQGQDGLPLTPDFLSRLQDWHSCQGTLVCVSTCSPILSFLPFPASRLEEELRQKAQQEAEAAARDKEKRKRDKMAGGKPKLSFALEVRCGRPVEWWPVR